MFHNSISLPFLEREAETFVRVIFVICLIFVVFDADEVRVYGVGVKGEGDEGVDSGGFWDDFEGPGLGSIVSLHIQASLELQRL